MDIRIKEKIDKIKQQEEFKKEEALAKAKVEEDRHKRAIMDMLPDARDYIKNFLFDKIAVEASKGKTELSLKDEHSFIPVESIVVAALEIDGLSIRNQYIPELSGHIYSDDTWDIIPAHYEYYVTWSKQ